jgi:hypothetical protein
VSYVDAGYAIVLVVITLYALSLVLRRRRLTRAAAVSADRAEPAPAAGTDPAP